jgi:hypothetical protein
MLTACVARYLARPTISSPGIGASVSDAVAPQWIILGHREIAYAAPPTAATATALVIVLMGSSLVGRRGQRQRRWS